jgi:hypothetical protein
MDGFVRRIDLRLTEAEIASAIGGTATLVVVCDG